MKPKTEIEHLLLTLAEECAEVIQRVMKAERWGIGEVQPGQHLNNDQRIVYEINDVLAVVDMLQERGILVESTAANGLRSAIYDPAAIAAKKAKVRHFMKYAREIGELE